MTSNKTSATSDKDERGIGEGGTKQMPREKEQKCKSNLGVSPGSPEEQLNEPRLRLNAVDA